MNLWENEYFLTSNLQRLNMENGFSSKYEIHTDSMLLRVGLGEPS